MYSARMTLWMVLRQVCKEKGLSRVRNYLSDYFVVSFGV